MTRKAENDPTVAAVDSQAFENDALAAVADAESTDELEQARVEYLGRKSALKLALREVRDRETGRDAERPAREDRDGDRRPRGGAPSGRARPQADRGRASTSRSRARNGDSERCIRRRSRAGSSRTPSSGSATRWSTTARSRRSTTTSTSSPSRPSIPRARLATRSSSILSVCSGRRRLPPRFTSWRRSNRPSTWSL